MKKIIKIVLISLASIVLLIALGIGGYFIYFKHQSNKGLNEETTVPEEVDKIRDLSLLIFNDLPNEVADNVVFRDSYEGYEDFKITYISTDETYLSSQGKVNRDNSDHTVVVKIIISYQDYKREYLKNITVLKRNSEDIIKDIMKIIQEDINLNVSNNQELPTKVSKYPDAVISWDKIIINRETGLEEPTIKIVEKDNKFYINFTEASKKEVCILNYSIKLYGMTYNKKTTIYTKTII